MNQTVRCVSTHPEDLDDGRILPPGGRAENVDTSAPHNARLLEEGRIFVEGASEPATVDQVLAGVGEDREKAQAALDVEQAASKPRKTLVDRLQAIVESDPEEESQ